ncbi:MAG: hypothetical protein JXX28_13995 [Deltaproteobacteria bacterium]|nr:hypothetical protein [Deltaproteobacteria bacterium]
MRVVPIQCGGPGGAAFVELPWRIYPGRTPWVPPLREATRRELGPESPALTRGELQLFLALDGEEVIGRIAAFTDRLHKDRGTTGFFGYFEVVDRQDAATALLREAAAWVRERGARRLEGPVQLSIFHGYRVQTRGNERSPFLGEPRTPAYYPRLLRDAGFTEAARWHSWDLDRPQMEGVLSACEQGVKRLRGAAPWRVERVDLRRFDEELVPIHRAVMGSFAPNFGYSQMSLEDFGRALAPLRAVAVEEHFFKALDASGEVVGFAFSFPDHAPAFQAMDGEASAALLRDALPRRLVFHSFGVLPSHQRTAVAYDLGVHSLVAALEGGYEAAIGALITEGRNFLDRVGPPQRSYAVVARGCR